MELKNEGISCESSGEAACLKLSCGSCERSPCSKQHAVSSTQHSKAVPPTRPKNVSLLRVLDRLADHVQMTAQEVESQLAAQRLELIGRVDDLFQKLSDRLQSHRKETTKLIEELKAEALQKEQKGLTRTLAKVASTPGGCLLPAFFNLEIPGWIDRAIDKSKKYAEGRWYDPSELLKKWAKSCLACRTKSPPSFPVLFSNFIFEYNLNQQTVLQTVLPTTPAVNQGTSCTVLSTESVFCSGGKFHSKVYQYSGDSVEKLLNMRHSRAFSGQVEGENCVFVFGGAKWDLALTSAEKYDFRTRRWSSLPEMPRSLQRFNPVLYRNLVHLIGACTQVTIFNTVSEAYCSANFSLPRATASLGFLEKEQLFILQGESLHRWNVATGEPCTLVRIPDMDKVWSRTSPVRIGNAVYFCNDFLGQVYALQLKSLKVTYVGNMGA